MTGCDSDGCGDEAMFSCTGVSSHCVTAWCFQSKVLVMIRTICYFQFISFIKQRQPSCSPPSVNLCLLCGSGSGPGPFPFIFIAAVLLPHACCPAEAALSSAASWCLLCTPSTVRRCTPHVPSTFRKPIFDICESIQNRPHRHASSGSTISTSPGSEYQNRTEQNGCLNTNTSLPSVTDT